jgi:CHAD domain-containing protein
MSAALAVELKIPPRIPIGDIVARLVCTQPQHMEGGDPPPEWDGAAESRSTWAPASHSAVGIAGAASTVNPAALIERREHRGTMRRTYYDSFGWRLYRKGLALVVETWDRGSRLLCQGLGGGVVHVACTLQTPVPRFAWEIAHQPLQERLSPILEMRALLPQASIEFIGETWTSADGVTGSVLTDCKAIDPALPVGKPLGDWLLIEAPENARHAFSERLTILGEKLGLEPADAPLLLQALTALGKKPEDPARQPELTLDPTQRSDQAAKTILRRLLTAMEINERGMLQRTDTEFLHDFRIAVRRTRSALGQIKNVFPDRRVQRFASGFAWLGQVTGPARDLDVYLLGFEELKANLPAALREGLDPLHGFLERHAGLAHEELARQLASRRYRRLLADWTKFLEQPVPRRPHAARALTPIGELADRRIWKTYRRALKEGRAIRPDSPAESLHELRKTCKKLRYLLEFFRSLYPPDRLKQLIKQLKGLQDYLGEFQDIHAQIDTLHRFSLEMRDMNSVPTDTLLAMGALLGHLDRRQTALRERFSEHFEQFSRNHTHFKELFARHRATAEGWRDHTD